jgi:RHS repeat-associated protein
LANSHGRDARDTHGQDAHATHGRDAHATPQYDQAVNNVRGPRPPQGPQGPADANANNAAHFRYDAWNRLATIHLDNGSTSGTLDANDTLLATYRYDGLNRRVMKAVDVDGNSVTDYMYHNEGWQIVEVRRGVNQTPTAAAYKQFVYDIRYIDSPVCRWWDKDSDGTMEPAAGEMQYFTNDGNFNTTALVDANSGGVVERYLYDPYGRVTVLNGASGAEKDPNVAEWSPDADNKSDWDNEILFCGYWYDPETGLFHVRERYYDPVTGTWKTRDRILYPDGMNLYEYCRGNPVRYLDTLGASATQTTTAVAPTDAEIAKDPFGAATTAVDRRDWQTAHKALRAGMASTKGLEGDLPRSVVTGNKECCCKQDPSKCHIYVTHLAVMQSFTELDPQEDFRSVKLSDLGYPAFPGYDGTPQTMSLGAKNKRSRGYSRRIALVSVITLVQLKHESGLDVRGCNLSGELLEFTSSKPGEVDSEFSGQDVSGPAMHGNILNTSHGGPWYIDTPMSGWCQAWKLRPKIPRKAKPPMR